MNTKFPNLFSPLKVGTHTYKNRIIAAPIYCGTFGTIPFLSDVFFQAFEGRSKGGCAQVTVGETPVDFEYANREPFAPIDYTNFESPSFNALKRAADNIKSNGAFALIELSHCGESKLFIPGLKNPIGPMGYVREDGVEVIASQVVEQLGRGRPLPVEPEGQEGLALHLDHVRWINNALLGDLGLPFRQPVDDLVVILIDWAQVSAL